MKDLFILGQEPANPFFTYNESGYGDTVVLTDISGNKTYLPFNRGISTRLLIAKDAMSALIGLISSEKKVRFQGQELNPSTIASAAFLFADELLKQEQNETNN